MTEYHPDEERWCDWCKEPIATDTEIELGGLLFHPGRCLAAYRVRDDYHAGIDVATRKRPSQS